MVKPLKRIQVIAEKILERGSKHVCYGPKYLHEYYTLKWCLSELYEIKFICEKYGEEEEGLEI